MCVSLPHLVSRLALTACVCAAVAACEPTWQRRAPVTGPMTGGGVCGAALTVVSGDTLYSISRRCDVSMREMIELNRLSPPYTLAVGQILRMPGGDNVYVVQRGDMLLVVARRLKVDFQTLARINNKRPPYTIYVGEKLKVPGSYSPPVRPESDSTRVVVASPNARTESPRPQETVRKPPPSPAPQPVSHPAFERQQVLPPEPPPMAGRGFIWPVKGQVITEFGPIAKGQNNDGINIAAPAGTPIKAAENGVVAYVGNEIRRLGNLVLVKHSDGWMSAYAHADQLMVRKGETVRRGQTIATVGASGGVDSPQLHFELRRGVEAVNPSDVLKGGA